MTWPNANTPLLPEAGATISLVANGAALAPSSSAVGERTFDVPDGTTELALSARFVASFGAVHGQTSHGGQVDAVANSSEVLRIDQAFTVTGKGPRPKTIAAYAGPHPLVVTKSAANIHGAAVITLRTLFVDIEPFWDAYCLFWDYYRSERTPGMTTFPLGYTGGMPIVWMASMPDAMVSSGSNTPSCMVFYRPASYGYSRLDQPHEASAYARYACKPKAESDPKAQDFELDLATPGPAGHYMRCGFEDAILQSKRALVMLHPWPTGSSFGAAETSLMPALADAAIRYLWAQQLLCKGVGDVHIGRLGSAAFSKGGEGHGRMLLANGTTSRLREIYSFDGNKTDVIAPTLARWFKSHIGNKLRLVNGTYNWVAHDSLVKTLGQSGSGAEVTVTPPTLAAYGPGHNTVYDHFVSRRPQDRDLGDFRHQFTICGGKMQFGADAPYDLDGFETFLLGFLRASDFATL